MQPLSQALLFGDYRLVGHDTLELFARTGLIHLLSASGFHMGVAYSLGLLCSRLLPFSWRRPPFDGAVEFFASVFIMTLLGNAAGWGKPIVRAFLLQLLWLGGKTLGLRPNLLWIFALSLTVSLTLGRGSLLSFFLSALSMGTIIAIRENRELKTRTAVRYLAFILGPWLVTLPVTVYFFQSAALYSPLYNIVFAPLFGCFAVLPLILALVFRWLEITIVADALSFFADSANTFLYTTLMKTEAVLGGGMSVSHHAFFLFLALLPALFFTRFRFHCLCAVTAAYFLIPTSFSARFLNVGQGDAALLQTAGEILLMDAGRKDGKVLKELANANVARIDHLFLTHPDADHVGGVSRILARMKIENAWISPEHLKYKKILPVLKELERRKVRIRFWTNNSPFTELKCIAGPGGNSNDTSPLCRFTLSSGEKILLTGDLSGSAELWFLKNHKDLLDADILKVSHHGSRSSSEEAFLLAVSPSTAVISAGKNNSYGHPHQTVLERLQELNVDVLRTEQGAIAIP